MKDNSVDLIKSNVFAIPQNDPLLVVDMAELSRRTAEHRAAQDAAEKKATPPDESQQWREELSELTRRLQNAPTEAEAKTYSDQQSAKHNGLVRAVERELAYYKSLLDTPGISLCPPRRAGRPPVVGDSCDACVFTRKISRIEDELTGAKDKQQKSIRICGGMVRTAKELDPLRPRWMELRKRMAKIESARLQARGLDDEGGATPMPGFIGSGEHVVTR